MADEKFSFPIRQYLLAKVKENYPEYENSVFEDLVVNPVSLMFQDILDRINVLKRSMSIRNYATMLEEDMDALSSNYFVSRITGVRSYGTIRLYLVRRMPITIDTSIIATKDTYVYTPISTQTFSYETVKYDGTFGEYYVDVIFQAAEEGSDYRLFDGEEVIIDNMSLVSHAQVVGDFTLGKNTDSNAELYNKIIDSVTNNELVKSSAIKKILTETFTTIQNIEVLGYGDVGMNRDIVEVMLPLEKVIPLSYCIKFNAPLNSDGEIQWRDSLGNVITSPVGGYVGCITDSTGIDFNELNITWDGVNYRTISAQPGFIVRVLAPNDDAGDFTVTKVEEAQSSPTSAYVKILRLDRIFDVPSIVPNAYKLVGSTSVNSFHIGGKVDILLDTVSNEEKHVVVSYAEASSGVIEIPLVDYIPETTLGDPMFEDNVPFTYPVLLVLAVDQVSYNDPTLVERELIPGVDYKVVRKEYRQLFTQSDYDVLRIITRDSTGLNPFINKRLRITYVTNADYTLIQDYVENEANKTLDLQVAQPIYNELNIIVEYSGTVDNIETLLKDYINNTGFGAIITSSAVNDLLFLAGATYIKHPIYLEVTKYLPSGDIETEVSADKIVLEKNEIFYPAKELSITNV